MRKLFAALLIGFLAIGGMYLYGFFDGRMRPADGESEIVLGVVEENVLEFTQVGDHSVAWVEVLDNDRLSMRPNFNKKRVASEIFENEECKFLINGGFYLRGGNGLSAPTGLFIYEGRRVEDFIKNDTLNGVLSVNQFGVVRITREVPRGDLRWALQTGPVLIENGFLQPISMVKDKKARRVVAIVTGENELYFAIFYNKDSVYDGPGLEELPNLLMKFAENVGINIADSVNLDGGSASVFVSNDFRLIELSPIGSYFCYEED